MELGEKIRQLRKDRQLSQGQLAERVGINATHMSRLETGKYQPSLDVLRKLVEALGASFEQLLGDSGLAEPEARIGNKSLAERIRLVDTLEEDDQVAVMRVIDAMLTKQRMRRLLEDEPLHAAS